MFSICVVVSGLHVGHLKWSMYNELLGLQHGLNIILVKYTS